MQSALCWSNNSCSKTLSPQKSFIRDRALALPTVRPGALAPTRGRRSSLPTSVSISFEPAPRVLSPAGADQAGEPIQSATRSVNRAARGRATHVRQASQEALGSASKRRLSALGTAMHGQGSGSGVIPSPPHSRHPTSACSLVEGTVPAEHSPRHGSASGRRTSSFT